MNIILDDKSYYLECPYESTNIILKHDFSEEEIKLLLSINCDAEDEDEDEYYNNHSSYVNYYKLFYDYFGENIPDVNKFWDNTMCKAYTIAVSLGHFNMIQKLEENGYTWDYYTMRQAIKNNNFEMVKYLHEKGCSIDNVLLYATDKVIIEYLLKNKTKLDDRHARRMVKDSSVDILRIAHELGLRFEHGVCEWVDLDLEKIKYLYEEADYELDSKLIDKTCDFDIMKYLYDHDYRLSARVFKNFANNINHVKYLHENRCPWDERVFNSAVYSRSLECVKYLYENDCPITLGYNYYEDDISNYELRAYLINIGHAIIRVKQPIYYCGGGLMGIISCGALDVYIVDPCDSAPKLKEKNIIKFSKVVKSCDSKNIWCPSEKIRKDIIKHSLTVRSNDGIKRIDIKSRGKIYVFFVKDKINLKTCKFKRVVKKTKFKNNYIIMNDEQNMGKKCNELYFNSSKHVVSIAKYA